MSIFIEHKFKDRLNCHDNRAIRIIILGTFTPGPPKIDLLNAKEARDFDSIRNTRKYIEFRLNRNFYDKSKNRLWKTLDILCNEVYYNNNLDKINPYGLKFYKKHVSMDRDITFQKQVNFCDKNGIFITDIVKSISPETFDNIYDNFSDKIIEKSAPEWNSQAIKDVIKRYDIQRVLVNFDFQSKATPMINDQISEIGLEFPRINIKRIMSPSGGACHSYDELYRNWKPHFGKLLK